MLYYLIQVQDVEGVEMCGTLKNIVAVAAGLIDGLKMGNNTKVSIAVLNCSLQYNSFVSLCNSIATAIAAANCLHFSTIYGF